MGPAAGGRKRVASQHIFLEERPERLHTRLIESREIPRQGGAMRQAVATKQGHKGVCPRRESFVERKPRRLARQHVAEQHSNKIDELILAKAGAGEGTCSWICVKIPVWARTRAKAATSPIQEGVAGRRVGSNLDGDWSLPHAESASSFDFQAINGETTPKRRLSASLFAFELEWSLSNESVRASQRRGRYCSERALSLRDMANPPGCMPSYPGQRTNRNR